MMAHALAEAQVDAIIVAAVDGLVTAQTGQHRLTSCGKSSLSGRIKFTFPKFMLHPTGRPGVVQAVPVVSVGLVLSTTFWSMLMVLSSCRLRTWVYSASNTELLLTAHE